MSVFCSPTQVAADHFDLCIIGSGPAGMIVALETARRRPELKILLLEFGRKGASLRNELDELIDNRNALNHHSPYECTNKELGGSSVTWGGRCVMYDAVDFENRRVVEPDCTWDETFFEHVKPYLPHAASYFDCGRPAFSTLQLRGCDLGPIAEGFHGGDVTDDCWERWSLPTRFGKKYRRALKTHPSISVLEGIRAEQFARSGHGTSPIELTCSDSASRQSLRIRAAAFVIAAGTQETTRLLLRSQCLFDTIGGAPYSLGRYYQGHISGKIASVRFHGSPRNTDYGFRRDIDGTFIRRRFQFSRDALVREALLNTAIWLDNPLYHDPEHRNGAMSLMYLAMVTPVLGKRLAPPAIANSVTKGKVNRIGAHVLNVLRGLPKSIVMPATIFFRRYCLRRKLPGIFLFNPRNEYALHFHAEQSPDAESRMFLAPDGETLVIDYRVNDVDVDSVIRAHALLGQCLRASECGELRYWFPRERLPQAIREMTKDGIHQSGTTRIADSPSNGVVDRSLRVFGTDSVYICSSSVFPTSGQANPTFFLGAVAVRLAAHLSETAQPEGRLAFAPG